MTIVKERFGLESTNEEKTFFVAYNVKWMYAEPTFRSSDEHGVAKNHHDFLFLLDKQEADTTQIQVLVERAREMMKETFNEKLMKSSKLYTFTNTIDGDAQRSSDGSQPNSVLESAKGHWMLRPRYKIRSHDTEGLVQLRSPSGLNLNDELRDGRTTLAKLRDKFYSGVRVDVIFSIRCYSYATAGARGNVCRLFLHTIHWRSDGERISTNFVKDLEPTVEAKDDPFVQIVVDNALKNTQNSINVSRNKWSDSDFINQDLPF